MNKTLKFSWGHILALLTLMFVVYTIFIGLVYKTDGNFEQAQIYSLIYGAALVVVFLTLQLLKATTKKFESRIIVERLYLVLSPFIFCYVMIPFTHFWSLRGDNDQIVADFKNTLENSKYIFTQYQTYAQKRCATYDAHLTDVFQNTSAKPLPKQDPQRGNQPFDKANMLTALRLQLLNDNVVDLQNLATEWIDKSGRDASVWNVFIIGNIHKIESSINSWHSQLKDFSQKKMIDESNSSDGVVTEFDANGAIRSSIGGEFEKIKHTYTKQQPLTISTIAVALLCYLLLLLPYILQSRHTKSRVGILKFGRRSKKATQDYDDGSFTL